MIKRLGETTQNDNFFFSSQDKNYRLMSHQMKLRMIVSKEHKAFGFR